MSPTRLLFALLFITSFLAFSACEKDKDLFKPDLEPSAQDLLGTEPSAKWLYSPLLVRLLPEKETFTIETNKTQTISATSGVELTFPGTLKWQEASTGKAYTGTLQVTLITIKHKDELLMMGKHTLNQQNELLETPAGVFLQATTPDGILVSFTNDQSFGIKIPSLLTGNDFQYLIGQTIGNNSYWSNPLNWNTAVNPLPVTTWNNGSFNGFSFSANHTPWICAARKVNMVNPQVNVQLRVTNNNFTTANTLHYAVFNQIGSIVPITNYDSTNGLFNVALEKGQSVTLVSIARIKDDYYTSWINTTVNDGNIIDINFEKTSIDALQQKLKSLR